MNPLPPTYLAGVRQVDITPPVGVYLAGFAKRNQRSTGIYHRLRAAAVAVEDGETPLLLVSAEWLGFYEHAPRLRQMISERTGIPASHIVVCGTHTHCGPALRNVDVQRHGEVDRAYLDDALERMAGAAQSAWEDRRPVTLGFSLGRCGFAASRRRPDGRGGVTWAPYPDGANDHDVPVLTLREPAGKVRAVIFGYACHPTARGGLEIGGDYAGFACDAVEAAFPGAVACFLQGCAGDQKPNAPHPSGEGYRQLELAEVQVLGRQLGEAVRQAVIGKAGDISGTGDISGAGDISGKDNIRGKDNISGANHISGAGVSPAMEGQTRGTPAPLPPLAVTGPLEVRQRTINLRTQPANPAELRAAASAGEADPARRRWAEHLLAREAAGDPVPPSVPFEVQGIRFGESLALVTFAAEMSVEHGLGLKQALADRFAAVWPIGYANGIIGYLPVDRQVPEGGYEVITASHTYLRTSPYVAGTEIQVRAAAMAALGVED